MVEMRTGKNYPRLGPDSLKLLNTVIYGSFNDDPGIDAFSLAESYM